MQEWCQVVWCNWYDWCNCKNGANQYGTVFAGENTWHGYCICKNGTKFLAWGLQGGGWF